MRRALGLILLALGVFAVAGAVLLPTYVYPKLAKVPLDQDSTSVLEGTASKVLAVTDKGAGPVTEIRKDAKLTATARVQANFARPEMRADSDYAVWLLAVQVKDDEDGTVLSASKRQVCFDRRTGEGYDPPRGETDPKCTKESSYVTELKDKADKNGEKPPEKNDYKPQPGLNFKFPFGTEQKDYPVYDDNTGKAVTAKFTGTEEVNGIETYKFVQTIPDTKLETKSVPGSLVGLTDPSVDADLYYRGINTMWVEPVTGIEVKQQQQQHQELRPATGAPTVVFDGTLAYNGTTIAKMVDQIDENKGKLEFLSRTGPLWLGIGGGVLIVVAIYLLIRRRPATPPAPPARRRVPVGAGR